MNQAKIVIDSGHGGNDVGATGNGIIEKDLTLKISQYMYDRFKELGFPVVMTRVTDETVSPSERAKRILNAFGNQREVIVISNHINAGGGDGAEVIYALRNNDVLSKLILEEISKEGQNIRTAFQKRLPSNPNKDYYFIHRDTGQTQPVIVEYGFLDSKKDDPEQLKNNYIKYADAVVRAVLRYLGITASDQPNTYRVQSGDSLWGIARKYNVTVDALKSANGLSTNVLSIGQVLKIPSSGTTSDEDIESGVIYVVAPGDSLYSIARQYGITVDELKMKNKLTSDSLSVGQELVIPERGSVPPTTETNVVYTVKSGDNLYSISRIYQVTVDELRKYNNLTTDMLMVGQQLRIPSATQTVHVVVPGDSLWTIAKRYQTTVDALRRKNNLVTDILSVGQRLYV